MFYIYATRRDDLTEYYWNRRKNEWQQGLSPACYYPTRAGVNRMHAIMIKGRLIWQRFHVVGWKTTPA